MNLDQQTEAQLSKIYGVSSNLDGDTETKLAQIYGVDAAPKKTSYLSDVVTNFKGGISAAGDIVTGKYQGIGENKLTPATQSLADKAFPQGYEGNGIIDAAKSAYKNTNARDYASPLLEKFGESLPGKAVQAIGGVIPTFNLAGTAIQKYANPAIAEASGMTEDEVALAELALSPLGLKAGRKASTGGKTQPPPKPFFSGVPDAAIIKAAAYPVTSPLKTAGFVVDTAGKLLSPVSSRAAKTILESDNKTFGGNLANDMASSVASEGARLGNKMGVNFSAGELTGNKAAMGFEDVFANSPSYAQKFAEANQIKTDKIIGKFNETLDKINPKSASRTDVGVSLGDAYRGTLDSLIKTRREQAKIDFGEAVKGGGGDSTILSNNLFRELNAIKDEGDAKLLTKSKSYGAALARNILKRTSTKLESGNIQADTINLQDMANGLSDFSSEASRPGSIMDNAQSAAERRVYARLASALAKDLDAEIENPKGNPQRAAMLMVARDNYLKHSNQISDINKTTLGKVIGQADYNSEGHLVIQPELLADRFSKLQPNELKNTMKFLDENHPDIAQMGRRFVLEEALRKATEGRGLRGEGTTKEFAKAEFVKNLPDSEMLNALLGDKFAAGDVRDVAAAMNRLIDYGASQKGSQTFGRGEFNKGIGAYMKGMLYRAVTSDSLVDDLMNPQKRRQIVFEANKINNESKPQPLKVTIRPSDKK